MFDQFNFHFYHLSMTSEKICSIVMQNTWLLHVLHAGHQEWLLEFLEIERETSQRKSQSTVS